MIEYVPYKRCVNIVYIRIIRILNEEYHNKNFNYDTIDAKLYWIYRDTIRRDRLQEFMHELKTWSFVKLEKPGSRTPFKLNITIPEKLTYDIVYRTVMNPWTTKEKLLGYIKEYKIAERREKILKIKNKQNETR